LDDQVKVDGSDLVSDLGRVVGRVKNDVGKASSGAIYEEDEGVVPVVADREIGWRVRGVKGLDLIRNIFETQLD
jgi:hypothetical protein